MLLQEESITPAVNTSIRKENGIRFPGKFNRWACIKFIICCNQDKAGSVKNGLKKSKHVHYNLKNLP